MLLPGAPSTTAKYRLRPKKVLPFKRRDPGTVPYMTNPALVIVLRL